MRQNCFGNKASSFAGYFLFFPQESRERDRTLETRLDEELLPHVSRNVSREQQFRSRAQNSRCCIPGLVVSKLAESEGRNW